MSKVRPFYLVVRLAEHTLALPIAQIVEVCRVPPLHAERGEATGLLGLATLRGAPTAVFDLGVLLGWAGRDHVEEVEFAQQLLDARLVTVRMTMGSAVGSGSNAAFLVDDVIGVREIADAQVSSIVLPGDRSQRIGEFDERFARLIDASRLIAVSGFNPGCGVSVGSGQRGADASQQSAEADL